jgi:hypothetical protein
MGTSTYSSSNQVWSTHTPIESKKINTIWAIHKNSSTDNASVYAQFFNKAMMQL